MKLTIDLSEEQEARLREMAARMRVPIEYAATMAFNEGLRDPEEEARFTRIVKKVVEDNRELLQRLGKND